MYSHSLVTTTLHYSMGSKSDGGGYVTAGVIKTVLRKNVFIYLFKNHFLIAYENHLWFLFYLRKWIRACGAHVMTLPQSGLG